jgi:NAD-dependent SIR2 family protein deacetylase
VLDHTDSDVTELARLLSDGRVVALTGAGISTESGIPDYRGATGTAQRRPAPMTYQAFTGDEHARRRYWARSHLGWRHIAHATPNSGHLAVAHLEHLGVLLGTITQNVDGLHTTAGSSTVIDLHGRLDRVVCLTCGEITPRTELDTRLEEANPGWRTGSAPLLPDGDAYLPDDAFDDFVVVDCANCGGVLKPDVVYFGENVPRERVEQSYALLDRAALLLVLGSSLTVFSGRRFVMRATTSGIPVAVVNDGPTRADDFAVLKLTAPLGATLTTVVEALSAG